MPPIISDAPFRFNVPSGCLTKRMDDGTIEANFVCEKDGCDMADCTAIVLTKNEEKNLPECLASIRGFASRVLVVDSGSTDRTLEIARAYGAEVLSHPFTYYAAQFNFAVDNGGIDTKWILRLDADERFPPEVCARCERLMAEHAEDNVAGIAMQADFYFLGRLLRHGGAKKRKIMLFKRGRGRIEDRKRDAHTILTDNGRIVSISERFRHDDFKDLNSYIARYNWYTIRELSDYLAFEQGASTEVATDAQLQKTRKRKFGIYYKAPMFLRAWLLFCYNYYFRLGFLDGRPGYIYAFLECYWYRFLVDAKLYEHRITGAAPEELKALGK